MSICLFNSRLTSRQFFNQVKMPITISIFHRLTILCLKKLPFILRQNKFHFLVTYFNQIFFLYKI